MHRKPDIYFYATPAEVSGWLDSWFREWSPFIAIVRFFPELHLHQLNTYNSVSDQLQQFGHFDQACVGEIAISVPAQRSNVALLDANPDCVVLLAPRLGDDCLREGRLGLTLAADRAIRLYQLLATDLKNKTHRGMWAYNPDTQAKKQMKNLRYSPEAKRLLNAGVQFFSIAGGNRVQIEEP